MTIVNRTPAHGQELVTLLNEQTETKAVFVEWKAAYSIPENTDILVNATSIGLFPDVEARPEIVYDSIRSDMIVCDVIPNPPHTPFLKEAEARGARVLDGLGMLVYQGAIGFTMWTGMEAPVNVMYQALQDVFG
jgi:shikimate dehydrogenase